MKVKISESLRYIGADKNDAEMKKKTKKLMAVILPQINPSKVCTRFTVVKTDDGYALGSTGVVLKGNLIKKTLERADDVFLFAATLGLESERLIKNCFACDSLSGVICDGILTAAIVQFCDGIENEIKLKAKKEGKSTKPRISCGYGDFDLRRQGDILRLLNAEKLLGIKLNDSFMMYPNKTVTAIIAAGNL